MANYVVAIPTYDRPEQVTNKTLQTLMDGGVNKNKIYLFVANKKQFKIYDEIVPKNLYKEIVIGKIGITNQRKFISKYFPEGQYIISIDDDLEELMKHHGKNKYSKINNLNKFFIDAYNLLIKENLYIWGVYPVRNPFFMYDRPKITTNLRFIIGVIYGYINRHSRDLLPNNNSETKEDYEISILYYLKDGGVLRFNHVTFKTKFNSPGGLGTDREERNRHAALYLEKTYPEIITVYQRSNGMYEVKFKNIPREIR
jgi:hypothetical protein